MEDSKGAFTPDRLDAAIRVWNRAAISLLDIRHNLISPEESMRGYRLPAGAFLFTSGGRAEVLLNDTAYSVERFGLFHGGKGADLTILPHCDWLEYYMVLYKAGESPFYRREYVKLLEQDNPFRQQYGFAPHNPLFFEQELRKAYELWRGATPRKLFQAKVVFYRLVSEIYEELDRGKVRILEPDPVSMAKKYMEEHYSGPVSIHELSELLGISYSHFHRSFKQQTGQSPQEYLIDTRLEAARKFLSGSQASVREIADHCGFQDERNLQRMFSKNMGMTPNVYRENTSHKVRDQVLGNAGVIPYNWKGSVSVDKPKGKGAEVMLKQIGSKALVAAALSLMLLMSACGAGGGDSEITNTTVAAVTAQVQEEQTAAPEEEGTRIISTVKGDVEVSANPKRIVTSGFWVGDVLAFGKQPIAIENFYVTTSVWSEQAKNIAILEKWEPEHIMALEPDLILTGAFGGEANGYEELSKIAPTIAINWDSEPEERLPMLAQALGLEAADGEALVADYNQKIENYRKKLEQAGLLDKTITVFRNDGVVEDGLELGSEMGWGGEVVYTLFGMQMPEAVQAVHAQENGSGKVSFEVVAGLCGDYILLNQSDPQLIKELDDNPIWQSIPAVQARNVFNVEPGKVYFPDIITDTYKLEVIAEALLELAAKK